MNLIIRIREEKEGGLATVWLIERGETHTDGLLYGVLPFSRANALAEALQGIAVIERETGLPLEDEPKPETVRKQQQSLFEGM